MARVGLNEGVWANKVAESNAHDMRISSAMNRDRAAVLCSAGQAGAPVPTRSKEPAELRAPGQAGIAVSTSLRTGQLGAVVPT